MKLKAALVAAALVLAPFVHAAEIVPPLVDRTEPPATPAGGNPLAGLGVGGAVGLGVLAVVIVAIAGGGDDDGTTGTTGTTGTN